MEPRRLAASRGKVLAMLAVALGFVVIAVWLPRDGGAGGGGDQWRWWCGGFFGLCAAVFTIVLVRPQSVLLDAEGFIVTGGLARRARQVRWRDVDGFFLYRLPRGGTMIGYNLTDAARPDTYMGDLSRRWGADGVLPGTLAGRRADIVDELNAYRAAALRR